MRIPQTSPPFLRHIVSAKGLATDPEKVWAETELLTREGNAIIPGTHSLLQYIHLLVPLYCSALTYGEKTRSEDDPRVRRSIPNFRNDLS